MVLSLFVQALLDDSDYWRETSDGDIVLTARWEDVFEGAVGHFVDWWLHRKWLGPDDVARKAPAVLRKWFGWCLDRQLIDRDRYDDFLDALPKGKAQEMQRLQQAAELLHRLHAPEIAGRFSAEPSKVVPLRSRAAPESIAEGYMTVDGIEGPSCWLLAEDGETHGPVFVGDALSEHLRAGDVVNVSLGLIDGQWKVLESGNVYAEGAHL